MADFTCITEVHNSIHLTQHTAVSPMAALRANIAALPYDDGDMAMGRESDLAEHDHRN